MTTHYGVFGSEHFHPLTGQRLIYAYVDTHAETKEEAERLMRFCFGTGWSQVVDSAPTDGPYELIAAIPHPGDAPTGKTVTLRVRITERLAQERAVWVAGRCVAFRPAPHFKTHLGAGVWMAEGAGMPDAWCVQDTAAVLGAGALLDVRYVPRVDAEQAAKADPANIQIVEGSASLGHLTVIPPSDRCNVSGTFTLEALEALGSAGGPYAKLATAASDAVATVHEIKSWRDTPVYVDVEGGLVVGVRVQSR